MRRPTRRGAPRFDAAAALVQRLAVLMDAGIPPVAAWRYAAAGGGSPVAAAVAASPAAGHELPDAIREAARAAPVAERSAWLAVAAAWRVAVEAGAPLAPTLARLAEVLRGLAQSVRDVEVALAGPVATARLVLALPAVGLLFGAVMGFGTVGVLFGTIPGAGCLALGGALVAAGFRWNRRLVRRASVLDPTPGLELDLLAVAVGGGSSVAHARDLVADALREAGLTSLDAPADDVLGFSRTAGVPAGPLLRAEAEEARRRSGSEGRLRAERLATRLLLPLGVCLLPAFVVLGVVPIVLSLLSSTMGLL